MQHLEALEYRHNFVIRQEETVRYQQYIGIRNGKKFILMVMVLVTLLARTVATLTIEDISETTLLTICTVGMAAGILAGYYLLRLLITLNVAQSYQSGRARDHEISVLVNPGGIYVTDGATDVRVYYDKMHRIVETAADFFIFPDKESVFLLPKHQLADPEKDTKLLRELFRTFAPENLLELRGK